MAMSKRRGIRSRSLASDFLKLSKSMASKAEELVHDLGLLTADGTATAGEGIPTVNSIRVLTLYILYT